MTEILSMIERRRKAQMEAFLMYSGIARDPRSSFRERVRYQKLAQEMWVAYIESGEILLLIQKIGEPQCLIPPF